MTENPMRTVRVEKVTLNIGVGVGGEPLERAKLLLNRITGATPVVTLAKVRNPTFRIKKGDPIGVKVTLRGKKAYEVLTNALKAVNNTIPEKSFDRYGNVSFGVKEYIDYPGIKYDPDIGILGFDVCVTLTRPGTRVKYRRRARSRIGKKHRVTRDEAIDYMKKQFNVNVEE